MQFYAENKEGVQWKNLPYGTSIPAMGFTIKEIQDIIDGPGGLLKDALTKRKKKLQEDIQHNENMISLIQDILKTL